MKEFVLFFLTIISEEKALPERGRAFDALTCGDHFVGRVTPSGSGAFLS